MHSLAKFHVKICAQMLILAKFMQNLAYKTPFPLLKDVKTGKCTI